MHWESYFVLPKNIYGDELLLSKDEARHLRVRRKKKGDRIWAVDGTGTAYEAKLLYITPDEARASILKTRRLIGEPVAEVTLAQGILKGERFDWLVEKATEMGIRKIVPMQSELCRSSAGVSRVNRWNRVAVAAMKQSGRSMLPEITQPESFKQIIQSGIHCQFRYIAHAGPGSVTVQSHENKVRKQSASAMILVGPEGGFTDQEIQQAIEQGFKPLTLGPRRLRAETAGIVMLTLLQFSLGELDTNPDAILTPKD